MCGNSLAELHGGRMGIRPQGALVLNHLGTIELARKKTSLGFREGETSLERAIAAEKVSDCLRGGVCVCPVWVHTQSCNWLVVLRMFMYIKPLPGFVQNAWEKLKRENDQVST